ncbi:maltodextrin glucosidase [Vibrio halioticoli NBRC 102217]|uniref:Maltodextrin glucosidase n=1 Tax=Vibrio halioticoli NBRC 102217 TaxID=1219072 RepID=V5FHM7_9VIBR|nr:maltodextrin glucosidase [Vibrio halioticoli]GAD88517.1 maltodextrin glucosidase [Vibrio halioticoli NBRC 102217]
MQSPFLFHPQSGCHLKFDGTHLTATLYVEPFNDVQQIVVRHEPDNEQAYVPMFQIKETLLGRLQVWQARFPINEDRDVTHYVFKVQTRTAQYWLDARGVSKRIPAKEYHFKFNARHRPAPWVQSQVFYQVFPDRFCNGNPKIGVESGEYSIKDGTIPTIKSDWGDAIENNDSMSVQFFNGDIVGIHSKLDYLQDLGVTTLYLNPVFSSLSNHKYDTTDYFNVDPHIGNNEELAELCQEVHRRGMRIVLDAVFNHTSAEHPWFDKSGKGECGAYHNLDSKYREYYFFDGQSQNYEAWNGVQNLPVLNFEHPEVRDYIYDSDSAVIKHWLRPPYSIDGWRFDVIHMLGEGKGAYHNAHYVQAFRSATKQENQEALVLGEHFFEATSWLQGDQEDGAMNYYGFAHPVRAFFVNQDIAYDPISLTSGEFQQWLLEAKAKLPWHNQLAQLNQLDSHDTARFITLLKGNEDKMRQAALFLMAYIGVPCLYYGTEVGLEGENDPDNRRCFPWERVESSQWVPFFKQMLALRHQYKALQSGDLLFFESRDEQIAFARCYGEERLLAVFNTGDKTGEIRVPVWQLGIEKGVAKSVLSHQKTRIEKGELVLSLTSRGCDLLKL